MKRKSIEKKNKLFFNVKPIFIDITQVCAKIWKNLNSPRRSLLHVCYRGDLSECQKQLRNTKDINNSVYGVTSLYIACSQNRSIVVLLLLHFKADIDICCEMYGNTALHVAAWKGHLKICELLIDRGANINCVSKRGFTPLHIAVFFGQKLCVSYLLEKGVDATIKSYDGRIAEQMNENMKELFNNNNNNNMMPKNPNPLTVRSRTFSCPAIVNPRILRRTRRIRKIRDRSITNPWLFDHTQTSNAALRLSVSVGSVI